MSYQIMSETSWQSNESHEIKIVTPAQIFTVPGLHYCEEIYDDDLHVVLLWAASFWDIPEDNLSFVLKKGYQAYGNATL